MGLKVGTLVGKLAELAVALVREEAAIVANANAAEAWPGRRGYRRAGQNGM
jgi:hypothetical protein